MTPKQGFWSLRTKKGDPAQLHVILVIPFFLLGIDVAFRTFFFVALGKAVSREAISSALTYGSGRVKWDLLYNTAFLYIPLLAWYAPIWRFIRTGDPALKETVRRRMSSIYRAIFALFGIFLGARILTHLFAYRHVLVARELFLFNLPAMLLAVLVELCFTAIFAENIFGNAAGSLMERIYTREELYSMRPGTSVSLVVKIAFLVISTAVVPMLMLDTYIRVGLHAPDFQVEAVHNLLINSFTPMLLGIAVVLGTLQRPVDNLVSKMQRLAEGDFDVKTRVYFSDEIARIKSSFNRMADQLRERETLRETFGKYVSVEVAKKLMSSGKVDLGGEEIEATVLFCDIRNFTPMSEKLTAKEVVDFLNAYFLHVTEPIMDHNGVINKFMGDAVMAIYAPILGSEDHVGDALRSASGMREALGRFNAGRAGGEPVRFGIGIQTGTLVAGNVGTLARLEYTVIGDTVNVASRLESATKDVGVDILVSGAVREKASASPGNGWKFEEVGPVSLKGKAAPMLLYALR
ncbi:MAG: HAMP domain-containing protein [Elusimicrobia bacterium]|nr:HAMP domain-containing protein [Elusimicrobiota bacterium]